MLQFAIVKAKFDKILIVLNEIKEWEFESVLFWSPEVSWARIADGESLYHLELIFRATVLMGNGAIAAKLSDQPFLSILRKTDLFLSA